MDFEKVKAAVKTIPFESLRLDNESMLEAVFSKKDFGRLTNLLDGFFGPPVFPSKKELTKQINRDIKDFGGLMKGQTLYYSGKDNVVVFVMLWPWGDGEYVTIKVIKR